MTEGGEVKLADKEGCLFEIRPVKNTEPARLAALLEEESYDVTPVKQ